jgi:hypothetical protein
MKLQRRAEAEKRQASHDERMKKIQALIPEPVLGVLDAPAEMELFAPDLVEVTVKKTRVRRRGKHVADG